MAQFPSLLPVPRGEPFPMQQAQGNIYSDIGQGLRQTAGDVGEFQQEMTEEEQRQLRNEELVNRRKMAMQAAMDKQAKIERDELYRSEQAQLKQDRAKLIFEENKRKAKAEEDYKKGVETKRASDIEYERKIEKEDRESGIKLNEFLFSQEEKQGRKLSDNEVIQAARQFGLGHKWKDYANRPPIRPPSNVSIQTVGSEGHIPDLKVIPGINVTSDSVKKAKGIQSTGQILKGNLSKLKDLYSQYGTEVIAGAKKGEMQTIVRDIQLELKELQNLGVLNGPDLGLLQEQIPNPTDISDALFSRGAKMFGMGDPIAAKFDSFGRILKDKIAIKLRSEGFESLEELKANLKEPVKKWDQTKEDRYQELKRKQAEGSIQ